MAQLGYPNVGDIQRGNPQMMPVQYPYGNNNLIMNTPYDNYMGRSVPQQNLVNQYLKCRPVASKEEARAFQIDLDGSLWVFTDIGNGKIYTKQINNDGTATFKTYAFTEDENPYGSTQYVTKEEFNKVIQALTASFAANNQTQPQQPQQAENNNLSF